MTLIGQDNDHFCAVATAEMILAFHGIEKTQTDIAAAMNTGPTGTLSETQKSAYEVLSNNALEATLETSFNFDELKQNILKGLPCKLGTWAHARAINGYQVARSSSGSIDQQLHIYDPFPPKNGLMYWENLEHTKQLIFLNFMFVRNVAPST